MRILLAALAAIVALAARAEDQPVVVELFTSQGCSACPPADALVAQLAGHDDVLPLALHVDYWDYIGWPDAFADPRYTRRQKAYARAVGERMIYTPQIIVAGVSRMVGNRPMDVAQAIQQHRERVDPVEIAARREGDRIRVETRLKDGAKPRPMVVQLVPFTPLERVEITGGENAGAVIDYAHIVRDWHVLGDWDGSAPWRGEAAAAGPAAVIVQAAGPGPILGAARVD